MKIFKLREKLGRRGLLLLEHGDGWQVTNGGTPKTLIEHEFADLEAVASWIDELPNRMTEVFDEEFEEFVNQCDGCRRGLPLDDDGVHHGEGVWDVIGCTRSRYSG